MKRLQIVRVGTRYLEPYGHASEGGDLPVFEAAMLGICQRHFPEFREPYIHAFPGQVTIRIYNRIVPLIHTHRNDTDKRLATFFRALIEDPTFSSFDVVGIMDYTDGKFDGVYDLLEEAYDVSRVPPRCEVR